MLHPSLIPPQFDIPVFLEQKQSEWKTLVPKMRLEELIEVAFKSPKFRNFMKQNKVRARRIEWDFSQLRQIRISRRGFLVGLEMPANSEENESVGRRRRELKPTDLNFRKIYNRERIIMIAKEMEKEVSLVKNMKLLTDVLIDIFEFKQFSLNWEISGTDNFLDLFIWDITKKFDYLYFKPEECENDEETLEALNFIFDEVTSKKLEIIVFNDNIVFRKALMNHEEVQIFYGDFFAPECFTNMTCKKIYVAYSGTSTRDVNILMKLWRNDELPTLKKMSFGVYNSQYKSLEDTTNDLFLGIEKEKSNKTFPNMVGFKPMFDIVSKSGKKASIDVFMCFVPKKYLFTLFVWGEDGTDMNEGNQIEESDDEEEE